MTDLAHDIDENRRIWEIAEKLGLEPYGGGINVPDPDEDLHLLGQGGISLRWLRRFAEAVLEEADTSHVAIRLRASENGPRDVAPVLRHTSEQLATAVGMEREACAAIAEAETRWGTMTDDAVTEAVRRVARNIRNR